jgi:alkylation response protein AidB-like acyl-CoA dehydrogenase
MEVDPLTKMEVLERIAHADGSTGWCAMVAAVSGGLAGGYATDAAIEEILADCGGVFPTFGGIFNPQGRAERAEGGYRVSGRWSFASNIHHSPWLFAAALATENGEPVKTDLDLPEAIFLLLPRSAVTVEDTWYVSGLAGTGSTHFNFENLFVAEHMTFPYVAPARRGGREFEAPLNLLLGYGAAACAIGAGQRALDEILELAPAKMRFSRSYAVAERGAFRKELGQHATALRAARLVLRDTVAEMLAVIEADREISIETFAAYIASRTHCMEAVLDLVGFAYRQAGAGAMYSDSLFQRIHRDAWAMSQHVAVSSDNWEYYGDALLGNAQHILTTLPRPKA